MISDVLGKIKAAEKGADDAVRKARVEGKRLLTEAHDSADQLLGETRGKARDVEKVLVERARQEAEAEAQTIEREYATRVEATVREGEAKINAAVAKILNDISAAV